MERRLADLSARLWSAFVVRLDFSVGGACLLRSPNPDTSGRCRTAPAGYVVSFGWMFAHVRLAGGLILAAVEDSKLTLLHSRRVLGLHSGADYFGRLCAVDLVAHDRPLSLRRTLQDDHRLHSTLPPALAAQQLPAQRRVDSDYSGVLVAATVALDQSDDFALALGLHLAEFELRLHLHLSLVAPSLHRHPIPITTALVVDDCDSALDDVDDHPPFYSQNS